MDKCLKSVLSLEVVYGVVEALVLAVIVFDNAGTNFLHYEQLIDKAIGD